MTETGTKNQTEEPKYVEVESSKYQEELIEALSHGKRPKFFYVVDEDILSELPNYEELFSDGYCTDWGSGLPAYIVSEWEFTSEERLKIAKEIAERAK